MLKANSWMLDLCVYGVVCVFVDWGRASVLINQAFIPVNSNQIRSVNTWMIYFMDP